MLKKLLIATSLIFSSVTCHADSTESTERIGFLKKKISEVSNSLNMSDRKYLRAAHNFERLISYSEGEAGDYSEIRLRELSEIPETVHYTSPERGQISRREEREALRLINSQKAELASYLGLAIEELNIFMSVYSELRNDAHNNYVSSATLEEIKVYCKDACYAQGYPNIPLSLSLYTIAGDMGVRQYEVFPVVFVNQETNNTIKVEGWKYNNFSGAWKHETRPCETCNLN